MNLKNLYLHIINIFSLILITNNSPENTSSNASLPKYLGENMVKEIEKILFLLPENTKISFNDSLINVSLYNTSDPSFKSEKMNIDFKNCLTILQKVYDLDPFYDNANINSNDIIFKRYYFIIVKIEIKKLIINENSNDVNINNNDTINIKKYPTNHIEYIIFDGRTKKLLNASYCNDLNIKISYPIVNETGLNLTLSQQLFENFGFDVFDPNDALFNDFCVNFTSDKKTDLTIKQKRKMYFQNVSYCDENCTYLIVNYTNKKAICACEVKSNSMIYNEISNSHVINNHKRNESFNAKDASIYVNYKVLTCYKQVFDIDRLKNNFGSYTILLMLVLYTICVIHFYRRRKISLMYFYQKMQNLSKDDNKNLNKKQNESANNCSEERDKNKKEDEDKKIEVERYGNIIISDISCPPTKKKIKLQNENQKDDDIKYKKYRMDTDIPFIENDYNNTNNESKIKKIKITSLISNISNTNSPLTDGIETNATKSDCKKLKRTKTSFNQSQNNFDNKKSTFISNLNYSMELPISNYFTVLNSNYNINFKSENKKTSPIIRKKTRKILKIHNNFLNHYDVCDDSQEDQDIHIENIEQNYNNNCGNIAAVNTYKKEENSIMKREFSAVRKRSKTHNGKNVKFLKNIKHTYNNKNRNLFIDFNQMKFEIAILIDNRNFCKKYLDELMDKYMIIISLFKDEILFKQLIITSYILNITIDFFFNALFNSDDYISKTYDLNSLHQMFINYPKEILSSFSSQFVVKLMDLIIDHKALELFIKRISFQNKKYFKSINYLMKRFEKKMFIYTILSYVLFIFMWYYCAAFCTTYQNTQKSLVYDSLESFLLNLLLPVPMSFLSVSLRHIAIKKLSKLLFFISNLVKVLS